MPCQKRDVAKVQGELQGCDRLLPEAVPKLQCSKLQDEIEDHIPGNENIRWVGRRGSGRAGV